MQIQSFYSFNALGLPALKACQPEFGGVNCFFSQSSIHIVRGAFFDAKKNPLVGFQLLSCARDRSVSLRVQALGQEARVVHLDKNRSLDLGNGMCIEYRGMVSHPRKKGLVETLTLIAPEDILIHRAGFQGNPPELEEKLNSQFPQL